MRIRSRPSWAALLALPIAACAFPAVAQQNQPPLQGGQSLSGSGPSSTAKVSDEKIDAAAKAMRGVATVKNQYQQRMSTTSPEEQNRIAAEGQQAIAKAVTDQGLTVDEYNSILETAENNPAVRDRLMARLQGSGSSQPKGGSADNGPKP